MPCSWRTVSPRRSSSAQGMSAGVWLAAGGQQRLGRGSPGVLQQLLELLALEALILQPHQVLAHRQQLSRSEGPAQVPGGVVPGVLVARASTPRTGSGWWAAAPPSPCRTGTPRRAAPPPPASQHVLVPLVQSVAVREDVPPWRPRRWGGCMRPAAGFAGPPAAPGGRGSCTVWTSGWMSSSTLRHWRHCGQGFPLAPRTPMAAAARRAAAMRSPLPEKVMAWGRAPPAAARRNQQANVLFSGEAAPRSFLPIVRNFPIL